MSDAGDPSLTTLDRLPLTEIAEVLERSFEGYFVPMRFSAETLGRLIQRGHVDLTQSYLITDGAGASLGAMLIARRGRDARVAALALVPEARGRGLGRHAVARAVDDATRRGERRIVLEVITVNHAARRLYEASGFVTLGTLVGYEWDASASSDPSSSDPGMETMVCDLDRALGVLLRAYPERPSWSTAPASFAGATHPLLAFSSTDGDAVALVEPAGTRMRLLALAVAAERRRQGLARAFMHSLFQRFPDAGWTVPPVVPETMADAFFVATGWRRSELTQVEMERLL